ncbi:hypothetical protein C0989_010771 [Termitomyces sp. Mn162]|nr:hypothetical protein C0989_010771 [Termitomyces sp. Mn162]
MITFLEGIRVKRLEEQRERLVQKRMTLLLPLYKEYLGTLQHSYRAPGFPDICAEEPFRSLIFSTPIDTTLTLADFAAWKDDIPRACKARAESQHDFKPSGDNVELYKFALGYDYRGSQDEAGHALSFQRPWNFGGAQVKYDTQAASSAKEIIGLCGADPRSVSKQTMDELDVRVECLRCGQGKRGRTGRLTMTWSKAITHESEKHYEDKEDLEWDGPRWKLLDAEDLRLAKSKELRGLQYPLCLSAVIRHAASKSVFISDKTHGRTDATRNPLPIVAVISGGGAGHEPAHAGYTGRGMLSASVSGDIFASPSAKQILQTIYLASSSGATLSEVDQDKQVHEWKDVLVIINNYTGDRLNFGLAIEKALASSHMKIESVVVTDDVSLLQPGPDSRLRARKSLVGPRGLAGNILVCKILGAFAHRGADLTRVKLLGDAVVHNLASVGVGLGHCHVPGRELNMNSLVVMTEEECEIGLGLHNEPGVVRKKMDGPDKLVAEMLDLIMRSRQGTGEEFMRVASDDVGIDLTDDIVLFINNLGGMSQLELAAVLDEVLGQLDSIGVNPMRVYSSTYMTSLNAPGFSISILNLSKIHQGLNSSRNWNTFVTVLELLDDPTDAVSWLGVRSWPVKKHGQGAKKPSPLPNIAMPLPPEPSRDTKQLQVLLRQGALTEFDTVVGDGDCGETFAAGAKAILAMLDEGGINLSSITVSELVTFVANVLEERMGGTIVFAIFLTAVSTSLKDLNCASTIQYWGNALVVGLHALRKYTPAQPGDRTLIDALCPFCETMSQEGNTFEQAVDAAKKGAESTRYMSAVLGRAAYVTMPSTLEDLPPDPGAWGVVAILEGLCNGLTGDP